MSNSTNSTGRRRAGRIRGIEARKGYARRLIARVCRREGKIIARTQNEDYSKKSIRNPR